MLPLPPAARMHAFHCSLHGARYASGLRLVRSASGHAVQACCLSSCHARTLPQRVGEEEETPSHFCLLPCLWPVCCKWRCRGWLAAACWCWASGERIATQTTFITCVHKRLWKHWNAHACNATERSVADELARRSTSTSTSEGGTTIVSVGACRHPRSRVHASSGDPPYQRHSAIGRSGGFDVQDLCPRTTRHPLSHRLWTHVEKDRDLHAIQAAGSQRPAATLVGAA